MGRDSFGENKGASGEVTGRLSEIFSSIQGEGIYAGRRMLFVRFAGCNLRCRYCDTRKALEAGPSFRFEESPSSGKFKKRPNPITEKELFEICKALDDPPGFALLKTSPFDATRLPRPDKPGLAMTGNGPIGSLRGVWRRSNLRFSTEQPVPFTLSAYS